jgi:hypothetical protein
MEKGALVLACWDASGSSGSQLAQHICVLRTSVYRVESACFSSIHKKKKKK